MLSLKAGGGFEVSFSPRRLVEFKNQNDTEARCAGKQGDDCLSPVSPLCTASMAELSESLAIGCSWTWTG